MSDYPRCKTCKWWDESSESGLPGEGHTCRNPKMDAYPPLADSLINSAGEYSTDTGPDFGCVHHEATDDKAGPER